MRTLILFLFVVVSLKGYSQLNYNSSLTPEQLVQQVLVGQGVNAFNVKFNGSTTNAQNTQSTVKSFNDQTGNFEFQNGLFLTTQGGSESYIDPDLSSFGNVTSKTVLEFDFVADGDSIFFNYLFASAEYSSYTCSQYNDVFGFFISGVGFNGTYQNNAENIATIPGGNVPVQINTVNSGSATGGNSNSTCALSDPNWQVNNVYFTNNYNSLYNHAGFNGGTTGLSARAALICGEIYHIKLAVSNMFDNAVNSGVYIQANSFQSVTNVSTQNPSCAYTNDGSISISSNTANEYSINNGITWQSSPVFNGLGVGTYEVCSRSNVNCSNCETITLSSETVGISVSQDTTICENGTATLSASATGGNTFDFIWDFTNDLNSNQTVNPVVTTTYSVTAENELGCLSNTLSTTVNVEIPAQTLNSTVPTCDYSADGQIEVNNILAVEYSIDNGNTWQQSNTFSGLSNGTYQVCSRSNLGCEVCEIVTFNTLPVVATLNADTTICENGTATLSATATGGNTFDFIWDFTNDLNSNQTVNPAATTTYSVTAENELGCLSNALSTTVNLNAPLSGSIDPDFSICSGSSDVINASVSGGSGIGYSFSWTPGSTQTGSANQSFSITPADTTLYMLTLSDNCESTPLILTTTVSVEFPIQTITQTQPTCNYTADGEIHVDNNLAIEYSIDNGITWQADTFFMNLPNGSYTVCSRSALGCITCENVSLNTPAVLLNVSADTTICQNDAALISANAIGGGSFLFNWDFTPNTDAVQTVLPFNSTTYTVVAENELGCFSTPESISVNVLELPIPSYTILTQPLCAPVEVEIENSTSNVAVQSVDWVIGNSQTFIDQNQITTASLMAGTYDIEMNVTSDQGCTNSLIFPNAIVVATPPTADFNYAPNPILMYDTEVQFSNTSVNGELYQWSFQSANPFYSVDQNPTTTFPEGETGEYVTTLITISQEGCQDTMQKTLEVVPELMIFAPNTFTPDGDEYNPRWKVHLTGIDIYSFSLLIYNRWGQVIWESNNVEVGWDGTFNNQLLPQGTYIWKVVTKDINTDKAYSFSGQVNLLR